MLTQMSGWATATAVGRVDAFKLIGIEVWFNSDDHLPPHFHAETDSGEVRVYFMREPPELSMKWGDMPKSKDKKAIINAASAHRFELLKEWESKVNVKTPGAEK